MSSSQLRTIAQIEQTDLTSESTLDDLPYYEIQVEETVIVQEVDKILREYPMLPGVIVTRANTVVGIISRRKFFEQLGQLYGVAVYLQRPIHLMLAAIGNDLLVLPANCGISEAAHYALNRTRNFVYEPIVVEVTQKRYRLIDVYTLLMAQSKLLGDLQQALRLSNEVLEDRIERRTAELVKTNASLTHEIAQRTQVEQALILARDEAIEASRLKSELVAKVSHELRTPLGGILGLAEMLQLGIYGQLPEQHQGLVTQIMKSTNYLSDMINQLLDQAKIDAGRLDLVELPFSPRDVVQEVILKIAIMAQAKGLELSSEVGANIPNQLLGDPIRITQILMNLVSNAIKFTQIGSVTIQLYCPTETQWAMRVRDTGVGIPKEAQAHIFEAFGQVDGSMTREHPGTGLGLSIVEQLTTLMGGTIDLESEIDKGSIFTITLPLQPVMEEIT
ncbi:MAG: ATP-binding protein [Chloroflexota bacterium]